MRTLVKYSLGLVLSASLATPAHSANVLWFPLSFSLESNCGFGCYSGHNGTDFPCGEGTAVYASLDGEVTTVRNDVDGQDCSAGFGNYVKIQNDGLLLQTIDAHLLKGSIAVAVGQWVRAGEYLGKSSNSGYTMGRTERCGDGGGYHLHFEVRELMKGIWTPVDPYVAHNGMWTSPLLFGSGPPPPTFRTTPVAQSLSPSGPYAPGQRVTCTFTGYTKPTEQTDTKLST